MRRALSRTQLPPDPDAAGAANQTGWVPQRVRTPAGVRAVAISGGDNHSVVLTSDGHVYACGAFRASNGIMGARTARQRAVRPSVSKNADVDQRALGLVRPAGFSADVRKQATFALVFAPACAAEVVTAIASGAEHVLLRCADGRVRSFVCAEKGRLGRLSERDADADVVNDDALPPAARAALKRLMLTPTLVPGLDNIADVAAVRACARACITSSRCKRGVQPLVVGRLTDAAARARRASTAASR
jgi:alpha-tubulin suppressor-like RCC1 family protein